MRVSTPVLLLISAPSGAGKTTVCEGLLAADAGVVRAITCTTRAPRAGETDAVDYYFLAPDVFAEQVAAGAFLEHATVYQHRYGTRRAEVVSRLAEGKDVLLNIDVQGAASVRAAAAADATLQSALVRVFLAPPSMAELERRLRGRGTDSEETVRRRLASAQAEIAAWADFDYLVTSASIEEDVRRVRAILEAERLRSWRVRPPRMEA